MFNTCVKRILCSLCSVSCPEQFCACLSALSVRSPSLSLAFVLLVLIEHNGQSTWGVLKQEGVRGRLVRPHEQTTAVSHRIVGTDKMTQMKKTTSARHRQPSMVGGGFDML